MNRLIRALLRLDRQARQDLVDVHGELTAQGFDMLGEGQSRAVYARSGSGHVLKWGCPDSNRREHLACSGEERHDRMPTDWISPAGHFLVMARAEVTLQAALDLGEVTNGDAEPILLRLSRLGHRDVRPSNIGFWNSHWRMLDLG